MRKIRVLQADALSKNIGGIEVYLKEQYCNIDREKMQYDFLTPHGKETAFYDEIISLGGNVYYKNWGGKGSRWNPLTYYRWYKFFKAHPYDIVVLNTMSLLNIDSIIFAKLFKVPVRIVHSHNAFAEKYTNSFIRNWLIKYNEKNIRYGSSKYNGSYSYSYSIRRDWLCICFRGNDASWRWTYYELVLCKNCSARYPKLLETDT